MFLKKNLTFLFLGMIWTPNFFLGALLSNDVTASVALLINAENGKVLFAKNADDSFYPASTTKIATALYALSCNPSLDQIITVSSDAIAAVPVAVRRSKHPSYRLEFGGTHMGLKAGEKLSFKSLLYGLMLSSANDAANVIAENVGSSVPQFMKDLNFFLQKAGCSCTNFTNPHGLTDLEHKTTAKDLAQMARLAMKYPLFREIVSSTKYLTPETNKQPERYLYQGNALVKPSHALYYPHATGIKTGYTMLAGHTIVASAQKGDRSLIAVVGHKEGAAKRYRSVIQLFEAAFQEVKENRTLFSARHDLFSQKIEGAKDILKAVLSQDVVVSFYPSEEPKYRSEFAWKKLDLPIIQGQEVGEVKIFDEEGFLRKSGVLRAQRSVEATFNYKIAKLKEQVIEQVHNKRREIGYLAAIFLLLGAMLKVTKRKKKESRKV